jgi:hypothetical protein
MECDRADRTGLKPAGDAISLFDRDLAGAAVYQYSVLVIHIVHIGSPFLSHRQPYSATAKPVLPFPFGYLGSGW